MTLLYLKAVHLIFVVSWFAGLFYIVRLFIYHTEAEARPEVERRILQDQFRIMERRLWNVITAPAAVLTAATGIAMFYLNPGLLHAPWMHVKLGFVIVLLGYHGVCWTLLRKLQRGETAWTSIQFRMWNEVATLLLVAIVFTVILKSTNLWLWGVGGLVLLGLIFMAVIRLVNPKKQD